MQFFIFLSCLLKISFWSVVSLTGDFSKHNVCINGTEGLRTQGKGLVKCRLDIAGLMAPAQRISDHNFLSGLGICLDSQQLAFQFLWIYLHLKTERAQFHFYPALKSCWQQHADASPFWMWEGSQLFLSHQRDVQSKTSLISSGNIWLAARCHGNQNRLIKPLSFLPLYLWWQKVVFHLLPPMCSSSHQMPIISWTGPCFLGLGTQVRVPPWVAGAQVLPPLLLPHTVCNSRKLEWGSWAGHWPQDSAVQWRWP